MERTAVLMRIYAQVVEVISVLTVTIFIHRVHINQRSINLKIVIKLCPVCNYKTIFIEEPVPDLESATVWHCMDCGTEIRPDEFTDRGVGSTPIKPQPNRPEGVRLCL